MEAKYENHCVIVTNQEIKDVEGLLRMNMMKLHICHFTARKPQKEQYYIDYVSQNINKNSKGIVFK